MGFGDGFKHLAMMFMECYLAGNITRVSLMVSLFRNACRVNIMEFRKSEVLSSAGHSRTLPFWVRDSRLRSTCGRMQPCSDKLAEISVITKPWIAPNRLTAPAIF